jgi:hypothetical protein
MPRIRIVGIASTDHATFFHKKKLLKPASIARFTKLFAVFYPLDREKTLYILASSAKSVGPFGLR